MEREVKQMLWAGIAALVVLITAAIALWLLARPAEIVIGSKNFTESRLLAEIMAQAVERRTGRFVRRHELGSTGLCWDALCSGAIHAYPEYSGTLLTDILKQPTLSDPAAALAQVAKGLANHPQVRLGRPFGLNDTYVLAMRQDEALRMDIGRISDLARHPGLIAGFTSEFNQRPDGWPGLARHYDLHFDRPPVDLNPGHMYQAVRDGQVAVISAFSTDARLRQFQLLALADDRLFFPAYEALPVFRQDLIERHPDITAVWAAIAGHIDDATMMALNQRVDLDGEPVAIVAASFLDGMMGHPASGSMRQEP
jgi:osmoprotectant transport system permease protein